MINSIEDLLPKNALDDLSVTFAGLANICGRKPNKAFAKDLRAAIKRGDVEIVDFYGIQTFRPTKKQEGK